MTAPPRQSNRKPGQRRPGQSAQAAREEAEKSPGLPARLAAAAILSDVVAKAHPLDDCFSPQAVPSRLSGLDPRDVALTRSICTAALRRLGTIRKALAQRLEKGLPKSVAHLEWTLIAAAAQILLLDVPDHAAVDLAVRATRLEAKSAPFAGLVNAVLRNIARTREEILAGADPLRDDVPAWLAARWIKTYGEEAAERIARANRDEPTLDLTVKSDPEGWAARLGGLVLPTGSVRLLTHAPIVELEGYEEGEWQVQDAAAALPARLLRVAPGARIADFCAAPGGKAAQLAFRGAKVTAIDRSAERLKRLAANFARLGVDAEIVVADVASLKAQPFDAVLLDAPCLSTGTIRRHPDVAWTKKPSDLARLVETQARMLDRAVELTRPGGEIVYCTCSLEPEEGEAQIAALLRRNREVERSPIGADEIGGLEEALTPEGELRTLPFHLPAQDPRAGGLDGFFAARLRRL